MPSAILKNTRSRAIAYGTRAPLKIDEFIDPSAEISIASVTHAAAPCPTTRSTTSDATCDEFATLANGNTFKQAALNSRYTTATSDTPPTNARGKFRAGSFTSDPTRFRSSHPSYAHNAAASAARNALNNPACTAVGHTGSPACPPPDGTVNATPITIAMLTNLIAVKKTCTPPPSRTPR